MENRYDFDFACISPTKRPSNLSAGSPKSFNLNYLFII